MKIIAVILMMLLLTGCDFIRSFFGTPAPAKTEVAAEPKVAAPDPGETLRDRLAAAKVARDKAIAEGDRMAQLQADKDLAEAAMRLAQQDAKAWAKRSEDLDTDIKKERIRQQQVWLWWFSGIMGLVGLLAFGLGIWVPLVRRYAWGLAASAAGVAAVAVTVAPLLPYLVWVGGGLLLLGGIGLLVWNRSSFVASVQASKAINELKGHVPDYKRIMRSHYDDSTDEHFDAVRLHVEREAEAKRLRSLVPFFLRPKT